MKHIKIFENFTLTDLEQHYQDAKDLYELGLIDKTELENVEAPLKLERYIQGLDQGNLDLSRTGIQSLGSLTRVGGYLNLAGTPIQSLGELREVVGNLNLHGTGIQSLGELREVGGLDLRGSVVKSLGELRKVGGDLVLSRTGIQSLGELREVGGYLHLHGTPISKTHTEQEIRAQVRVDGPVLL
jgi:hypothetical protein